MSPVTKLRSSPTKKVPFAPLFVALRPRQWLKNVLVFAAPLFSFSSNPWDWINAMIAGVSFCAMSSAVYLLNDLRDLEADRRHPRKRYRPIAAGWVKPDHALLTSILLFLGSLIFGRHSPGLAAVLLIYAGIQANYILWLKQQPLLDILCIASGFLLRAIAGGTGTDIPLSPWFLLTVGLLALFLAIEKRRAELRISRLQGKPTRAVLQRYSFSLLQRLESMVSTSAFMSYALWSAGPVLGGAPTRWMLLTLPFVLVGIFRYQLLSDPDESDRRQSLGLSESTESPEEILIGDRGIQLILLGWLLTVVSINVAHNFDLISR
ncbi:MAG: decaprenyl-phosphate phosphoribosyltransferase [Cyanothece sp. SIO1E1]|nr:decaprenyl-phosphate phosphoribosyltransferase [Cyanothece sp. SIO1E1]